MRAMVKKCCVGGLLMSRQKIGALALYFLQLLLCILLAGCLCAYALIMFESIQPHEIAAVVFCGLLLLVMLWLAHVQVSEV